MRTTQSRRSSRAVRSSRSSRAVRTTWLAAGSILAVATLGWGSGQAVSLLAHQRQHLHTVVTAALTSVYVSSGSGKVHIVGGADAAVVIDATVSKGLFSPSERQTLQGSRLVVTSSCPPILNTFCGVDYTIHIPSDLSVKVRSSGGAISLTGVNGDLDLSSSGGGITVHGGHGNMVLGSSGGTIRAEAITSPAVRARSSGGGVHLTFLQPPTTVSAGSSGGGVSVDLPNTPIAYQVHASSSGGSTHNDVRTDPTSSRIINAHSSGGDVEVRYATP